MDMLARLILHLNAVVHNRRHQPVATRTGPRSTNQPGGMAGAANVLDIARKCTGRLMTI